MDNYTEYYNEMDEYEEYMQQQYNQQAWDDQWSDSDASLEDYVYEDKRRNLIKPELIIRFEFKQLGYHISPSKFKVKKNNKYYKRYDKWDSICSICPEISDHLTEKKYLKLKKELYKYKINQENKKLNRLRFNEVITELKHLPGGEIERQLTEKFDLYKLCFRGLYPSGN